ncbi:MAG: AmmeMemoRadiSam system protein A, partial [Candidatus Omnitrophica bacterium]|nr:AmmeMemoRadiSam system protein A [Candidatus Omnitrophota bacterium]
AFSGVSVYAQGAFRTPLGEVMVDKDFTQKLLNKIHEVSFVPEAFAKEHALEVQIPFLQKVLPSFLLVPIIMGDSSYETCQRLAILLKNAIGERKDVLVVASTDLYHGYDFQEALAFDKETVSFVEKMDSEALFKGLENGQLQMCGGYGVVTTLILSKLLGHDKTKVLCYTNSAEVTGKKEKGVWTVGYVSCAIDKDTPNFIGKVGVPLTVEGETAMLNKAQRKRLLEIARKTIDLYLKTGKKMELTEADPVFNKEMGAFVTLHKDGELRGCIGNIIGKGPLYLTVRDMAIEAATDDPRFSPVEPGELKNIEIEISVLTPLEKIDDVSKIKMGVHGVLVRKGFSSGVFLPQVATETGWSKEEFLSNLCAHKAGLAADAWKDKSTDIYIFSAEVFSEKEVLSGD